jgi:hypothetical protein
MRLISRGVTILDLELLVGKRNGLTDLEEE